MNAFLALALAVLGVVATPPPSTSRSNALWRVVHDLCVTDMKVSGSPAPCLAVNRSQGYAVLKDLRGKTQVLLIPTARVTGIDSPALLEPGAPNYWQYAWDARVWFERAAKHLVPREDIALAINSIYGRTQNQLHIHVDCVRPDVRATLDEHVNRIGDSWRVFPWKLAGARYQALRIYGKEPGDRDPFRMLAAEPQARADMGRQTLALIGATFSGGRPGFYLLAATGGTPENARGAAESLMDHTCEVLHPSPAPLEPADEGGPANHAL
jgi:CDP-diacylglycerol pyrophosphatase